MIYFLNGGRKQINFIPSLWGLMHKNTYANVPTLSAIAISAILLTSFTMVGMQSSQHALAQNATSAGPTNATSAGPTNATSAAPSTNNTASQSAVGQSFVNQGTASSQVSPLAGHAKEYVVAVLKPRSDGAVYSGVLTYSASKGANVEIWNAFSPGNTSSLASKAFGTLKTSNYNGMPIAMAELSPSGASGSVPFTGNAVLLHATSPFTVLYTVNAVAQPAKAVNNIASAMAAAPPAVPKTLSTGKTTSGTSNSTGKTTSSGSSSSSSKSSKSSKAPQPSSLTGP
ncbi:MAG: hypothetical protein WAZ77_23920 [Candidatus Nitrosopolaris sp.]